LPKLKLKTPAKEQLHKLDRTTLERIDLALSHLQANPQDVGEPLRGHYAGRWKMVVGNYRIIYRLREGGNLVIVEAIRARPRAYGRKGS
jgi:mRNA-degrading endonuclease RelE of RelBE toxin-antitoxin system